MLIHVLFAALAARLELIVAHAGQEVLHAARGRVVFRVLASLLTTACLVVLCLEQVREIWLIFLLFLHRVR